MSSNICDVCGEDGGTVAAGDLLLCTACAHGEGEDTRPACPRCGGLVPHSFLLATWNHDNIFIQLCCWCGYRWDERAEGRDAPLWCLLGVMAKPKETP
jgi:hypothetical protein